MKVGTKWRKQTQAGKNGTRRMDAGFLSPSEERDLLDAIKMTGCKQSRDRLVLAYLPLVSSWAKSFASRSNLPYADFYQEGVTGLIRSIDRFDLSRENRFSTYAVWWVRSAMQDLQMHQSRAVRPPNSSLTKLIRSTFDSIMAKIESDARKGGVDLSQDEKMSLAAKKIGVDKYRLEGLVASMRGADVSVNVGGVNTEEDTSSVEIVDSRANPEERIREKQMRERVAHLVNRAASYLSPRERDIVQRRRLMSPPQSLNEIGKIYDISRERVRQIEVEALSKMRNKIEEKDIRFYADV